MSGDADTLKAQLSARASELGFDVLCVTGPDAPRDEIQRHTDWLTRGYDATLTYLSRNYPSRYDARSLLQGCRSVVVLAHSYYVPAPGWPAAGVARIARYAWGDDYHDVLGAKLTRLGLWLGERLADHQFKVTVDASPLAEKAFAVVAGAGWRGKHSLVVNAQLGSYFLIGTLLTTAPLEPDLPLGEGCGDCTACLEACPTGALVEPGVLNAGRCISYINEHGVDLGPHTQLHGWLYGCDACQEACPYNASPLQTREPRFVPRAGVLDLTAAEVPRMSSEEFQTRFGGTVLARRTLAGLKATAARLG